VRCRRALQRSPPWSSGLREEGVVIIAGILNDRCILKERCTLKDRSISAINWQSSMEHGISRSTHAIGRQPSMEHGRGSRSHRALEALGTLPATITVPRAVPFSGTVTATPASVTTAASSAPRQAAPDGVPPATAVAAATAVAVGIILVPAPAVPTPIPLGDALVAIALLSLTIDEAVAPVMLLWERRRRVGRPGHILDDVEVDDCAPLQASAPALRHARHASWAGKGHPAHPRHERRALSPRPDAQSLGEDLGLTVGFYVVQRAGPADDLLHN
jgi:hypothetical protein